MKKNVLMLFAAAAVLVSCSDRSNDPAAPSTGDDVAIRLKSSPGINGGTRAPFEGDISGTNELQARVIASITEDFAQDADIHANGRMNFRNEGSSNTTNSTMYDLTTVALADAIFPGADDDDLYLLGLHPYLGWDKTTKETYPYTFAFSGKEDVLASNVATTSKDAVAAGTYSLLTFEHLLTKLVIKIKCDQDAIDEDVYGAITDLSLVDSEGNAAVSNSIVVSLDDDNATTFEVGSGTGVVNFFVMDGDDYTDDQFTAQEVVLTDGIDNYVTDAFKHAYAMVAPHENLASGADAYFIQVTTQKGADPAVVYNVPVKLNDRTHAAAAPVYYTGNTAGHSFEVTLFFTGYDYIQAIATVTEWEDEGDYIAPIVPAP